ncbi:hypothetical protein JAAARDRAFT_59460 [Jaapia argillacea MUCL 33604]|uniref:Acyl-coenzyme A oxidase n=1 Tax=Jaapia argillacea MUCL 33604 TaxID=933084 RepID=A0A067PXL3_9AGAM|nr:hypothetical protein JAAARDRAFT_59460 [Jaapia argillacea MUCL 33604]
MAVGHDACLQNKLDMENARVKSTAKVDIVRDLLHNGRSEWETHQRVVGILSQDPVFDKSQRLFMTRSERYKRALAMTTRVYELAEIHNWSHKESALAINLLDEQLPMFLHAIAFEPVFTSQASPSLFSKYASLIAHRGIVGCYLQTELAHGTNVSSLETTATFIQETQEFEIHSPTLTSSKWWIGALGKTATHGIVQAKLILEDGKDVGPHLFLVQLRCLNDHRVLPGIEVGDIGPKAMGGFAPTDNGFARFDRVRIPAENMLSKFAQVTPEGKYVQPPHAKISYGGMLYIRSSMVTSGGWLMAKAATISIRYCTVRRQGTKGLDGLEQQVISYPSTYYRLLPILSRAYVFISLGRKLTAAFDTMSQRLAKGDASLLAETHAMTSGLKVLVTTTGIQDLETARRAMGGHGYSAFAGLGRLYADYLPSATYEGDNYALDQQIVRSALKAYSNLGTSLDYSSLSPTSSYLRLLSPNSSPPSPSLSSWNKPDTSIILLEWRAAFMVRERALCKGEGDASLDQRVSRAVSEAFVASSVGEMIGGLELEERERRVVGDLFRLYLLTTVESALVDLFSFGLFRSGEVGGRDSTRELRMEIKRLCEGLLPEAIGLTDAFGFTDWELDSALGVRDGMVYQRLWDAAQKEPLNEREIPDGYEEYIKPMLERGQRLAGRERSKL